MIGFDLSLQNIMALPDLNGSWLRTKVSGSALTSVFINVHRRAFLRGRWRRKILKPTKNIKLILQNDWIRFIIAKYNGLTRLERILAADEGLEEVH